MVRLGAKNQQLKQTNDIDPSSSKVVAWGAPHAGGQPDLEALNSGVIKALPALGSMWPLVLPCASKP